MAKIWCVGSGKGGVGKTFISSGLAVTFSKLRKKVLVIDFDMSGANLHTTLQAKNHNFDILDYLTEQCSLKQSIMTTHFPAVDMICGFKMAHLDHELGYQKAYQLIKELRSTQYDYVIFDLGPGASKSNLNLMALADKTILVSTCEQTAVEKTYRFVEQMMLEKYKIANLSLVVNSCRLLQSYHLGESMNSVILKKWGLNVMTLGHLSHDNAVWQSALLQQNVFAILPYSEICHEFFGICKHFIDPEPLRAVS